MPPVILEGLRFLLLLTAAMICSAAIGFDRERKNRPAALRTHVIVCVASALVMYIGIRIKIIIWPRHPISIRPGWLLRY